MKPWIIERLSIIHDETSDVGKGAEAEARQRRESVQFLEELLNF